MTQDIPSGSQFPDLKKAGLDLKLDDLVKGLVDKDQEFYQLAQDKKIELNKQRGIDLQSFWISQANAIERGNTNACNSEGIFSRIRENQNSKVNPIVVPTPVPINRYGKGKNQTKLPYTRTSSPTRGNRSRPPSMTVVPVNQTLSSAISSDSHKVDTIAPTNYPAKAARNMRQFAKAQAGDRGTSIGDRAVVFTANGTPMYGDSYLDKNAQENLSANQATSNLPIAQIPRKIETGKPISAAGLQQQPRANVAPKGDTTANLIALGAIATAITALLFFFQHFLIFVQMILQISSVTSTITNIAGSFVAILNNTGSLFGLCEGLIDPISKTFDSILNNIFGKEKVDYVKFQFAKISSAFVAGQNLISKVSGLNNTIGKVTEKNANNTSKIGNAMKMMGMIGNNEEWMNENNRVNATGNGVAASLNNISGLASTLTEITNDVKTAKESIDALDKEQADKEKEALEATKESTEKNSDPDIPDVSSLGDLS